MTPTNFYDYGFYAILFLTFFVCLFFSVIGSGILVTLGLLMSTTYIGYIIGEALS